MTRKATLVFMLLAAACARQARAPQAPQPLRTLIIAETTDLHGWIAGRELVQGPLRARAGGLDVLGGYLDALRAAHPGAVVLLDGGDLFQGTLESNRFEGKPVIEAMNLLSYDGAAVGNHEFDFGPVGPRTTSGGPGDDPLGALSARAAEARFPLLAANVQMRSTGSRPAWLKPWILVEAAGTRVGVVGLATPTTPAVTMAANVESLVFTDPVPALIEAAHELRAKGARVVVAVAHMGGACRKLTDPHDLSSCQDSQEAFKLLRALPAGTIDAYLGGHTHQEVRQIVNGVPMVQPAPLGKGLATIEMPLDAAGQPIPGQAQMRLTMVCREVFEGLSSCDPRDAARDDGPAPALAPATFRDRPVRPRADVAAVLAPYLAEVERVRAEPLGIRTAGPFTREYRAEGALGNLVAEALRDAVPGADFGITNAGGLRANLPAGELTFGDLFGVLPFDNRGAVATLSGADIREVLGAAEDSGRGVMQVAGLRVVIDGTRLGAPSVVSLVRSSGEPILDDQLYTVVTSDFLATGGDGWKDVVARLPEGRVRLLDAWMRDLVIEALQRRARSGPLQPVLDGRIEIRNAPKS